MSRDLRAGLTGLGVGVVAALLSWRASQAAAYVFLGVAFVVGVAIVVVGLRRG